MSRDQGGVALATAQPHDPGELRAALREVSGQPRPPYAKYHAVQPGTDASACHIEVVGHRGGGLDPTTTVAAAGVAKYRRCNRIGCAALYATLPA
jgi:hypothetical protein